jgi:hypothetical protein
MHPATRHDTQREYGSLTEISRLASKVPVGTPEMVRVVSEMATVNRDMGGTRFIRVQ